MKVETDWEKRYLEKNTGWDIGYPSDPLKVYFDQLTDKSIKILIAGCGNAHEAAYLFKKGFHNIFLLDVAPTPLRHFAEKHPNFPKEHLIQENFFEHEGQYDLMVEQTFFCAIPPTQRATYAKKAASLLKQDGKLVGLLFDISLNKDHPPYGGSKEEYLSYFKPYFHIKTFETAYNSIPPRAGNELFINLEKIPIA